MAEPFETVATDLRALAQQAEQMANSLELRRLTLDRSDGELKRLSVELERAWATLNRDHRRFRVAVPAALVLGLVAGFLAAMALLGGSP